MATVACTGLANDPFTGIWRFCQDDSRLTGPVSQEWIQVIEITNDLVRLREDIVLVDGTRLNVTAEAKLDGGDYPVHGSPAADTIAYARLDRLRLTGRGKKAGKIVLNETVTISEDCDTMTICFSIRGRGEDSLNSVAVFKRERRRLF